MKQIFKKSGFTLIELLVVIVILGILSTISVGTFRGYFAKARDAERLSTVQSIAKMIKADSGGMGNCGVYNYTDPLLLGETYFGSGRHCSKMHSLDVLLATNDFSMPKAKNGIKYYYGFYLGKIEGNNEFFVATVTEEDAPQNGKIIRNLASGAVQYYLFAEGTTLGIESATEGDGGVTYNGMGIPGCLATIASPEGLVITCQTTTWEVYYFDDGTNLWERQRENF